MRRRILISFFLPFLGLLILSPPGLAQQPQTQKPLTNSDVIRMIKSGVPESVILISIQSSPPNYDVSPDGLIALQKAGVSQQLMTAILTAQEGQQNNEGSAAAATVSTPPLVPAGTPTPPPATPIAGQPSVAFLSGNNRQEIPVEKTQLAETKTPPKSMAGLASDSAVTQGLEVGVSTAASEAAARSGSFGSTALGQTGSVFTGIMSRRKPMVTYVWAVQNPASANASPMNPPSFAVSFAGIASVNPEEFEPEVVILAPSNNFRLIGATRGKADEKASTAVDWQIYTGFVEDRVATKSQKLAPGQYQISVTSPLAPGEYAVVLRPISKTKQFSGAAISQNLGDGIMFNAVWSFQVPASGKP